MRSPEFDLYVREVVKEMTSFFGLSYWPEDGQIIHSLRTALISPEGKLVRLFRGNHLHSIGYLHRSHT